MAESTRIKRALRLLKLEQRTKGFSSTVSFKRFYAQTHVSVFRYIYSLLSGPKEIVEDLTADTFLRAWKARRSFSGNCDAALAWLFKIARRIVIDYHRRHKPRVTVNITYFYDIPAQNDTPEDKVLSNEQNRILWRLIKDLPQEQKEIIALRYILDWRVNRIASFLEIPENTVSVKLRRILQRLRDNWPYGEEWK